MNIEQKNYVEQCPNCGVYHQISPYKKRKESGKTISAPNDISCTCGINLRPIVPLFKVSGSGYQLRQLLPSESFRS